MASDLIKNLAASHEFLSDVVTPRQVAGGIFLYEAAFALDEVEKLYRIDVVLLAGAYHRLDDAAYIGAALVAVEQHRFGVKINGQFRRSPILV